MSSLGNLRRRIDKLCLVPARLFDSLGHGYILVLHMIRPSAAAAWNERQNARRLEAVRKLTSREELSIRFSGNFDYDENTHRMMAAFKDALAMQHKLPEWIERMEGMSGKKYRYFINNLVSRTPDARYLEVGSWTGSTACSALFGNTAVACCIDNWSQFGGPRELFEKNIAKALGGTREFKFIEADFRKVKYGAIGKYNMFCFDGPHSEADHYDGLAAVQSALDSTFALIIDDWNWENVRKGTFRAIEDLGIRIRAQIEIRTTQDEMPPELLVKQFSDWHNGYFLAVCEKRPRPAA